eukprot:11389985-Ditylum_brightwellii.AAC.1
MRELLLLRILVEEVAEVTRIKMGHSKIRCSVWRDNVGALTLSNMEQGRITPELKHYEIKVHCFRSKLDKPKEGNIKIRKIASANNLSDTMTKGLGRAAVLYLRKVLLRSWADHRHEREIRDKMQVMCKEENAHASRHSK